MLLLNSAVGTASTKAFTDTFKNRLKIMMFPNVNGTATIGLIIIYTCSYSQSLCRQGRGKSPQYISLLCPHKQEVQPNKEGFFQ